MEKAVRDRDIKCLWHFTRVENLASILKNGIVPRQQLEDSGTPVTFNDYHRHDGQKSGNCLSICHPNYKMFYSLRQQYPDQDWIVIAIDPKVLWTHDCAFCKENAASNQVTSIPIADRRGVAAFNGLFDPVEGKPSREELKLSIRCPTNPQAEVLIFGTIEPTSILLVASNKKFIAEKVAREHPSIKVVHHPGAFSARIDHAHW